MTSGALSPDLVRIHHGTVTRDEALREATDLLVEVGAVTTAYYAAMQERERSVSTYMGAGLAIPHGTNAALASVQATALTFVRYDGGVDWDGNRVTFVVGIAARDGEHLHLLGRIAELFADADEVAKLAAADTVEELYALVAADA